ncbi:histidine--tRNA ligase [Plebeiibacterium sediminum]|uniref:Histidine--tRNA ligase n=1 Tax=Plebeiibacterium sediminum TaxID=2992112 RepID=A0AAE3M7G7_9BACT|nr:histidine--tRNA ligase [Plebeiobacterium sediminum]MCW3788569.1 histidine--tRNA ligase [Plebeiobacterium sediminum]
MAQKPAIPKGTRDFSPIEMAKRNFIFDTIKSVFLKYGYQPIETPAMENLSTLMGKYGEEGDKLLFKILNSGDFLSKVNDQVLTEKNSIKTTTQISEKGLRYDLTVPFARFVVQHQNDITFPFKRYQIQPVWRADRPQKGRYREFYQCDVDVVGSDSLMNEVELIQIVDDVYKSLNINVVVKLNNRKILTGIAEIIGEADKIVDITVAIDKLDKIGLDKVNEELRQKNLSENAIEKLQPIIKLEGTNAEKIHTLKTVLAQSETGLKGVDEVEKVFEYLSTLDVTTEVELDLTLARGLNYYTGAIFEVKALDVQIGSITGGGRYDDLTGIFGLKDVSGVGISFGADRIYDVMNTLDLYPKESIVSTQLLFINFGEKEALYSLKSLQKVRAAGIKAELYPDAAKMKKQMNYANKKEISFVAMAGEDEINAGKITLKNMTTGDQQLVTIEEAIEIIK